jgi:hypothetical protein
MSDPITLGLAATAVTLVKNTISVFKEARESAKYSEDNELKGKLNEIFDQFIDLKAAVFDLAQENADLRKKIDQRGALNRNSSSGFFFQEGDPDPFCPVCFERDEKLIHLGHAGAIYGGEERACKVCGNTFYPKQK